MAVAGLVVTLEAQTARWEAGLNAAAAQLNRMDRAQVVASRSMGMLQSGMRQLATQAIGVTGPVGQVVEALGLLGGGATAVMGATAAFGAMALAVRAADREFEALVKRGEELERAVRAAAGATAAAFANLAKAREDVRGAQADVAAFGAGGFAGGFRWAKMVPWHLEAQKEQAARNVALAETAQQVAQRQLALTHALAIVAAVKDERRELAGATAQIREIAGIRGVEFEWLSRISGLQDIINKRTADQLALTREVNTALLDQAEMFWRAADAITEMANRRRALRIAGPPSVVDVEPRFAGVPEAAGVAGLGAVPGVRDNLAAMMAQLRVLEERAQATAEALQLAGIGAGTLEAAVISGFGNMVEAAIAQTDRMGAAVVSSFITMATQILQAERMLAIQRATIAASQAVSQSMAMGQSAAMAAGAGAAAAAGAGGFLASPAGAVAIAGVAVLGGIVAGILGRNRAPQRVILDAYSSQALAQRKVQEPAPRPVHITYQIIGGHGLSIEDLMVEINRAVARGVIPRLPRGATRVG